MIIRLLYAPRPNSAQKSARTESAGWLYVQKRLLYRKMRAAIACHLTRASASFQNSEFSFICIKTVEKVTILERVLIHNMMNNAALNQNLPQLNRFFPRAVVVLHQPVNCL